MNRFKNVLAVILLLLLSFNLMSCSGLKINDTDHIVMAPKTNQKYINGVWKVTDVEIIDKGSVGNKNRAELMNTSISFCDSMATIGSETLKKPKTKLKRYYSNHYLLYDHHIDVNKLSLKNKDVINVISVYKDNNMFCEVIANDSNNAYIFKNGALYKVTKISNMNDILPDVKNDDNEQNSSTETYEDTRAYDSPTGVLIGLKGKRYKDDNNALKQDYRTLWIPFAQNKLNPVLEKEDLFVPRLKGFTILSVEQNNTISGKSREEIRFSNTVNKTAKDSEIYRNNTSIMTKQEQKYMDILFVSTDYISAQCYEGYSFSGVYDQLKTLPIDNPNINKGVSIDVIGANALKSYQDFVEKFNEKNKQSYKCDPTSFGMVRQNGYWALRIRMKKEKDYHDDILNFLPTKKLIVYDRLCVGWSVIKDRVPDALDFITSPTGRIAIVMTKNKILVYEIKNGELNREPLKTINLKDGEKMIMAEWANNEFVESWTKSFMSYGNYREITDED